MSSRGTMKPWPDFNHEQDAEALKTAVKGSDTQGIINILAYRNNEQRLKIAQTYMDLFSENLNEVIKNQFSGDVEKVLLALMMPVDDYLASEVKKAVAGPGTDEEALIEILCTRTREEIERIKDAYGRLYGTSVEMDVVDDTSGDFQKVLVSIIQGNRSEAPADGNLAKESANVLFKAGVKKWGTDEDAFIDIITGQSFPQLTLTLMEYEKLAYHPLEEAIKDEMSGDLMEALLTIVFSARDRPYCFAHKLDKAVKGMGTDDEALIRIIVSRSEVDMEDIKWKYHKFYGNQLQFAVGDDTSGQFSDILVRLIRGNTNKFG